VNLAEDREWRILWIR